ncbi:MAG: phosphoenolpyruvate--protein phosphotransferase [Acidiferrobacterales bacterium]
MLVLHGAGVSSGICIGTAYTLRRSRPEISEYLLPDHLIESEIERFSRAIKEVHRQLSNILERIPSSAPKETSSFIDAHILILNDSMISEEPIQLIRNRKCNAEWALHQQGKMLTDMFGKIEDQYIRSKSTDVIQVVDRIIRNLLGQDEADHQSIKKGQIIIANDLTPADTVLLKHKRIRAFVTDLGGPISHTAILARSLQIPAIVAVHNATRFIKKDEDIIIDGKRGVVILSPDKNILTEYRKRNRRITQLRIELEKLQKARSVTKDGKKILLHTNIELPADVKATIKTNAAGIGLYRTEFLFMNRLRAPDEEEQFKNYVKVVKAIPNRPVTIRTLDLGADKQVDGGKHSGDVAINPALGLRALRLCLKSPEIFRPQLRAILRASAFGKVRLMLPMISGVDELLLALEFVEETKADLKIRGIKYDKKLPVGGMIEIPSAAIAADLFAPHLDFMSIGTNDLIQYTLAIDRVDDAVNYLYDPLHPAVLRLIQNVIEAGRAAKIPVAMCGEMAGDLRFSRLLLGMGLTEFSMHPASLLGIKKIVKTSNIASLKRFAKKILATKDIGELHATVDAENEKQNRRNA